MKCRTCKADDLQAFVDLGSAPPSNAYLTADALRKPEKWFPLRVLACRACRLVQTEDFAQADELFDGDYAYFSAFSTSWLAHSERYVADMAARFELSADSRVVEVAANDGYLLQYVRDLGIPCVGVEPTASTARAAREKGIEIIEDFFGVRLAAEMIDRQLQADLTAANNVLAHVPDINDFVSGFTKLLKPHGVSTFEFPHLLRLVLENQFDTIYHEHFSYLSLTAVQQIFERCGLGVFDVQQLDTHGGSLRVFTQRLDTGVRERSPSVDVLLRAEADAGIRTDAFYEGFQGRTDRVKDDFVEFLLSAKRAGKRVCAYGAAAKGNTLMNYAGVRPDLIAYVVDRNPAKQRKFMPGSRIPILPEDMLRETRPDYVVILPWNLRDEIVEQLSYVREWGARFVTAVPHLKVA